MDINIHFLKTFIALAQFKNFTLTAKKLHMTQPGVSQHIKNLEEYLHTSLLEKHGKHFELTNAGEKLLDYAQRLLTEHQTFLESIKEDNPFAGKCRFASPGSFGIQMYSFLLSYNKKHPELSIQYYYSPNATIETNLLNDELDMGFMSISPLDPSLQAIPIDTEKLCLIVPAAYKTIHFDDLIELGFINHPDGPNMADQVLSLNFPKEYRGINKIKQSGANNQITRILEPVALGFGFTVLPEYACQAFPFPKKIKIIPLKKEVHCKIYAVSKKRKSLASRFKCILDEYEKKHIS